MSVDPGVVYDRPAPQVIAAMRALRTVPAPATQDQHRRLSVATTAAARTAIDVTGGRITLGWDADADGVWASEEMTLLRSARPAPARLTRALAACLRACWPDRDKPLYPGVRAPRAGILDAIVSLGAIGNQDDPGKGGSIHAKGALITLEAAGLIEQHPDGTVTLGPVIATWPERDLATVRANWDRLPTPSGTVAPVASPTVVDATPTLDDVDVDADGDIEL